MILVINHSWQIGYHGNKRRSISNLWNFKFCWCLFGKSHQVSRLWLVSFWNSKQFTGLEVETSISGMNRFNTEVSDFTTVQLGPQEEPLNAFKKCWIFCHRSCDNKDDIIGVISLEYMINFIRDLPYRHLGGGGVFST